jgi:hypothetical protein
MFQGNISPPSPGLKSKLRKRLCLIPADFLLDLHFNPEDRDNMFL